MPSSRQAINLTDNYRQRLTLMRQRAELVVASEWAKTIDPADLDGTHERWRLLTALRLTELQRASATLSAAYLTGFLTLETKQRAASYGASAAAIHVGVARDGKPLRDALLTSLLTVKMAIGDGKPVRDALTLGLQRAVRNSNEDVAQAGRSALDDGIRAEGRIVGWRRVTGGGCGACLAAATGAIQADDVVLDVHPACQCSKEPVVDGARETVHRPTGEAMFHLMSPVEQDALFAGSGGAEKADLLRSGQVPFHALVEHQHMAAIDDVITERSLTSLQDHSA